MNEDSSSQNAIVPDADGAVIVPIPPSGALTVRKIPFTQQKWISYEAQWSDGAAIPDGTIRRTEPELTYFYYMFVPRTNPRAEYFFVGTASEKDRFLQKATWTAL